MILQRIICLAIGYVFGLFQTGYFYSKKKDFDLRAHGSGNTGATNTLRTMGVKAGIIVLVGDALKCILAVLLVRFLYKDMYGSSLLLLQIYAGAGCVLGHDFPCYLNFKGGKGMSSTVGMIIGAMPIALPVEAVLFFVPVLITQYVSLGSILAYFFFPLNVYACLRMGWLHLSAEFWLEAIIICILLAILAIYQHRTNVKRLLHGEENKFFSKKK